jgi:transcriptional regulator with XRE-family HTH domain
VRLRRVEAGIRQDQLAKHVGISAGHLSRFERGMRDVSLSTLDAIVRALVELGVAPLPPHTSNHGPAGEPSKPSSPASD